MSLAHDAKVVDGRNKPGAPGRRQEEWWWVCGPNSCTWWKTPTKTGAYNEANNRPYCRLRWYFQLQPEVYRSSNGPAPCSTRGAPIVVALREAVVAAKQQQKQRRRPCYASAGPMFKNLAGGRAREFGEVRAAVWVPNLAGLGRQCVPASEAPAAVAIFRVVVLDWSGRVNTWDRETRSRPRGSVRARPSEFFIG
jgi:hypothetical protein